MNFRKHLETGSFFVFVMLFFVLSQSLVVKAVTLDSLNGTDIYNGLRGQNFDEGWKFNLGEVNNGQSASYNDSSWSNVTLPHDWSIYNSFNQWSAAGSGGGYLDGGIGWYRKTFTVPSGYNGKKVFIEFDGAYMNSQVWINGNLLGTRPYGYSSFEYDLTPYLVYGGKNVVAVRINNNQPTSRWYSGSGIYRNVWLTVLNQTHVDYCGMSVTTPNIDDSSATVNVSTKVVNQSGASKSAIVTTTIMDDDGNTVTTNTSSAVNISVGGSNTFNQNLTVSNPQLWSTTSPYLYTAQVQVIVGGSVVDTYQSTFGIRYFNFDANTGFSLNGVSMKLNGVCNHHDLGSLGAAVNYRAIQRECQILKDMGCNAIRMSHNPPDPQLLDICDRLGLLVMDEAFDCWETGKNNNDYHLFFGSWAQTDLQDMVKRDRNHPSIIIWSVGNEIPSPTVETATNLRNWVRAIDTTRPVTTANFAANMGDANAIAVANVFDLVGYNYFAYTYDGGHSANPAWKMFGSETSSAVRSRGVYKTPTNQNILTDTDNQCSSYDNSSPSWGYSAEYSYSMINSRNYMAGEFVWTGFDYIGEPTPYGWPSKSSYFGIVDTCGFPKDIYYFYQSKWTTAPMVHILPHWNWSSGSNVEVWTYSNCDTVELFLNGVSLSVKNAGGSLHQVWNVPWVSGTLHAKGVKNGVVVYDQVTTAGPAAKVRLKPDRTCITADGKDLVYIETEITDANNVLCPNATNMVNFSVSGPGKIVGVDNGNAPSTESYKGNSRMAFSGKCLVIIQATKSTGSIVVTATSSGLSSSSATIFSAGATATPALPQIEAENYDIQWGGIQIESCSEGGQDITGIRDGSFVVYRNVDFGSGAASFQARVASGGIGGNIELRLDSLTGAQIGTCMVPNTGGWQTWVTQSCPVGGATGVHDLYLKFTGGSGSLFNLNWWRFNSTAGVDIGAVGVAGSASYSNGVYTVTGSGAGIQGASDAFHFVYVSATGDCAIVARVSSVQNTGPWAKAGVMIRESLDPGAANAFIAMTPSNGVTWQYRSSTGGATTTSNTSGLSAPYWIKLLRSGNMFTAYRSPDGVNWTEQGSTTFSMASTAYIGLAVTSNVSSSLCMATFDNVSAPGWSPALAPAPSGLVANALSSSQVNLAWNAVTNATSYNVKRSITSGGPYNTIASGVTATSYTDGSMLLSTGCYYVVSAMVGGSETPNSAEAAPSFPKLTGTIIGTPGSWNNSGDTIVKVFDSNLTTFFDAPNANGAWVGLDFGVDVYNVITKINYCPRSGHEGRMTGGIFQGANQSDFSDAATLFTIGTQPAGGVFTSASITNTAGFRYVRYLSPDNGFGNVAELEFYGYQMSTQVSDGTYKIVAKHSGKAMDASGMGSVNGTQIVQWGYLGGSNQLWNVIDTGGGQYKIISVQNGKCIEINGSSTANNAKVQLADYVGGANQKFSISAVGGGYYRITPTHALGSCLDVESISTSDGAKVLLWSWGSGQNQQWYFQAL